MATDERAELTSQRLVRYEALFALLEDIQRLDDVGAIAQRAARQWKYIANVAAWRLVVERSGRRVAVNASRGEAEVLVGATLSEWDEYHWDAQRPERLDIKAPLTGPPPPDFLTGEAVSEIEVIPIVRHGEPIALLSAAARHRPFGDLGHTFTRMLGGHLADRFADILLRQHATDILVTRATRDSLTAVFNRGAFSIGSRTPWIARSAARSR